MRNIFLILLLASASPAMAFNVRSHGLVEPKLFLASKHAAPTVALTFDACMGATDMRILNALIDKSIPATIFVTKRWLQRNAPAFEIMKDHPYLFEIEDHGARHIPTVDRPMKIYGIATAGSPAAVRREVEGGAAAIVEGGAPKPRWFRGATAIYSPSSMRQIRALGYKIAGFSINGDGGASFGVRQAMHAFAQAKDGDVIIAHINQPTHKAGIGVVRGIEALQKRGFHFVRLDDEAEVVSKARSVSKRSVATHNS